MSYFHRKNVVLQPQSSGMTVSPLDIPHPLAYPLARPLARPLACLVSVQFISFVRPSPSHPASTRLRSPWSLWPLLVPSILRLVISIICLSLSLALSSAPLLSPSPFPIFPTLSSSLRLFLSQQILGMCLPLSLPGSVDADCKRHTV